MTTYNHTAISNGAAGNSSVVNTPLGALDAAIGDVSALTTTATNAAAAINELDALIGAAASSSGSIATSIDTDGTLKAGAVDVAAVLADAVVTAAKIYNGALPSPNLADDPYSLRYPPVSRYILQDGRRRWVTTTTSATRVADATAPGGYVTRIPSTENQGRKFWLDEMNLLAAQTSPVIAGDSVSIDVWAKIPTGLTLKLYLTFRTTANVAVGSSTLSSNYVGDDTVQHMVLNANVIPATATNFDVYFVTQSGSGNTDIYSWTIQRGDKIFTASVAGRGIRPHNEPTNLAFDAQNLLLDVGESPDERLRWYLPANATKVTGVAGTGLGTPIIRIAGTSTTGRFFWLDEMGLKPGDVISIGIQAKVGTGRTFLIGYGWYAAPGTSAISSASYPASTLTGEGTTAVYAVENLTIPATAEIISIFPTSLGGSAANVDIYAWYVVKGPSLGDNTPATGIGDGVHALKAAGKFPAEQLTYGRGYLRDWFAQVAKIRTADGTSQAVVGLIGDSWMHLDARLAAPIRETLQDAYGNGGPGYVSANSDVNLHTESSVVSRSITGTWANHDKSSSPLGYGPDLSDAYTEDTATPAKITWTATSTPVTDFDIYYLKLPNGLGLEYQVDSGGWSAAVDTNAAEAMGVISITGLSDANGHVVEVRAAAAVTGTGAGGLTVMGVDCKRTGVNGVRVLKLGANGSRVDQWNDHPSATVLVDTLESMGLNLAIITLGTNDDSQNVVPATFFSELGTLITTLRTVNTADTLLLMPSDNGLAAGTYSAQQYASAARAAAVANDCAAFNSFLFLGDYTTADARGLYGDTSHINITGGRVITRGLYDTLLTA